MARSISRFRFPAWTVAVSSQEATCQHLQFSSGVCPVYEREYPEQWTGYIRQWLRNHDVAGKLAILTQGPSMKHPEINHRMEIVDLSR
jgi:pyruvate kinase